MISSADRVARVGPRRRTMPWARAGAVGVWLLVAAPLRAQMPPGVAMAVAPRQASQGPFTVVGPHDAANKILERTIALDVRDVPLDSALRVLARAADGRVMFGDDFSGTPKRVTIRAERITVRGALDKMLDGIPVQILGSASGQSIVVRRMPQQVERAPDGAVIVHVVDSVSGKPLEGAIVVVRGTGLRGTTNENGTCFLGRVPAGAQLIVVRHLGYMVAKKEVTVADSQRVRVEVPLRLSMTRLEEVVTTATGPRRRMDLPNDVTVIDADSIVATEPISSVTDLLEGRVPGLTVQHTSGAPGDPSRLRLRGIGSAQLSNDPIVIVDGVRVYAAQSDSTSGNLASFGFGGVPRYAAPSPLDQIDPHSIETIEVLKGPSAATLYGPDAANGVIVITTKRGHSGPARWTASVSRGFSYMPGQYPMGVYRWGTQVNSGGREVCVLTDFRCVPDGDVVRFQALNDPRYTILGHGGGTSLSLGVSGGSDALTYNVTGSYADQLGIPTLPNAEVTRFEAQHGAAPPTWMRRPETLTKWSGTSLLEAKLGAQANVSLISMLTRERQQRSDLEQQLAALMGTYVDPATGVYWRGSDGALSTTDQLVPDFYQRATDEATNFTNGANLRWRPRGWLETSADAGVNVIGRRDEVLLPRHMTTGGDSVGALSLGNGTTVTSTVNLRATATVPLRAGFLLQIATGANYASTSNADITTGVSDLAEGTTSLTGAGKIMSVGELATDVTSLGWYVEPTINSRRFSISTGLRIDGSSSFGTHVKIPKFPKLGVGWLVSDEPFFPFKRVFNTLRLRAAYGQAGKWPGPREKLRLFQMYRPFLDTSLVDASRLLDLGNTHLRPERSTEMEGGFDADLLDDRLSVKLTFYRKMRYDALMDMPVPPSVYGNNVSVSENIGAIRNTGFEMQLQTQVVRTDPVAWSVNVNLSRNHNVVTKLGEGVRPFYLHNLYGASFSRVAAGYPLFGAWARPILGYADVNGNGIIEASEVQLGDTAVFLGDVDPKYQADVSSTLSLFRGAVTVRAALDYQNGVTQWNGAMNSWNNTTAGNTPVGGSGFFSPGFTDPAAPFGEQAAVAVMDLTPYGLMETVSTLRLNSLSVAFNTSPSLARRLGARSLSVALQGTNLGLWTNYRGKDPNVNAYATGNSIADTGVLPMPRQWLIAVKASY